MANSPRFIAVPNNGIKIMINVDKISLFYPSTSENKETVIIVDGINGEENVRAWCPVEDIIGMLARED